MKGYILPSVQNIPQFFPGTVFDISFLGIVHYKTNGHSLSPAEKNFYRAYPIPGKHSQIPVQMQIGYPGIIPYTLSPYPGKTDAAENTSSPLFPARCMKPQTVLDPGRPWPDRYKPVIRCLENNWYPSWKDLQIKDPLSSQKHPPKNPSSYLSFFYFSKFCNIFIHITVFFHPRSGLVFHKWSDRMRTTYCISNMS